MPIAVVTGSGGLVGSEAVRRLHAEGYEVVGIENDMRARFFGPDASTAHVTEALRREFPEFRSLEVDIRDEDAVDSLFAEHGAAVELVVHAAAQPSHDWAATEPKTDFAVNAWGTLNLLEAVRANCPAATFVFVSTNKLYGDRPNRLPLEERETRLELPADHPYFEGIDTSMSLDRSTHSLFGVSKTSADFMVQEYGRYFGMPTVCFRCGCITGPAHAGTILHGFLAYLMKCAVTGTSYTIFGFGGKQVRDNLHSADLVEAFLAFHEKPRAAAVYNLGGGRPANCSLTRRSRPANASPAASCGARSPRRRGSATTGGGSRTSASFAPTTPRGRSATGSRRPCARSTPRTWSAGPPRSESAAAQTVTTTPSRCSASASATRGCDRIRLHARCISAERLMSSITTTAAGASPGSTFSKCLTVAPSVCSASISAHSTGPEAARTRSIVSSISPVWSSTRPAIPSWTNPLSATSRSCSVRSIETNPPAPFKLRPAPT